MIKKLRHKFIITSFVSIAILILLIFSIVNIVDFAQISIRSDEITYVICDSGGVFPDQIDERGYKPIPSDTEGDYPPPPPEGYGGETSKSIRYFSVAYYPDGTYKVNTKHISAYDDVTAKETADQYRGRNVGWASVFFRYRAMVKDDVEYVVLINLERELAPAYNVLETSIIGSSIGLVLSLILLFPLSKAFVKPLEVSSAKQKRFISDASHELKTPLTIISANNEIEEITHGESEQTRIIAKEVKFLSEMVKDLNSLAKLDEGDLVEPVTNTHLSRVIEEMADSFSESFYTRNKKLYLHVEPDIHMRGRENSVARVAANIFSNAVKYSATYASFSLKKVGKTLQFREVNDTLKPINDGPIDHIFERFYRTDESRGSGIEGSGIGLAIVKETVDLLKGKIRAFGENGNFVIEIEIPVKR